ncbi:hypothetical protein SUGI_0889090 [Cryptomeria japonica]|nr:hypothetical protein SUGI_0889090 [Cryptomeria japonica]
MVTNCSHPCDRESGRQMLAACKCFSSTAKQQHASTSAQWWVPKHVLSHHERAYDFGTTSCHGMPFWSQNSYSPYDDCFAALMWLKSYAGRGFLPYNADVSCCFLMGDNTGGNIVHQVGCRVAENKDDFCLVRIVGHVLMQPFFGGGQRTLLEKNMPPCLVVIGGMDILRDRQLQYMEYLKKMKKEMELLFYETAFHGFFTMPYPLSSQFLDDISSFIDRL